MSDLKYKLAFGELERPRNESKLVLPIYITTNIDQKEINTVYLLTGDNVEEISKSLTSIDKTIQEYLEQYYGLNFSSNTSSVDPDLILIELGSQITEAFKKVDPDGSKYLTVCNEDDQRQIDDLCIELGIDTFRLPEGMSRVVSWIMKNALKKIAVRAKGD